MTESPSTVLGILTVSPQSSMGEKKSPESIAAAAQIHLAAFLIKFNLVKNFHNKRLKNQVIFHVITVTEALISIYH